MSNTFFQGGRKNFRGLNPLRPPGFGPVFNHENMVCLWLIRSLIALLARLEGLAYLKNKIKLTHIQ